MNVAALVSGGVDSAVAVHLLKEAGHDITLFYIRIGRDDGEAGCTFEEDVEICRWLAKRYGLPFEIVELHQEYWDHVMQYALDTVARGLTPNPDMMCNRMIKFGFFEQRWGKDFDVTATGHYASRYDSPDGLAWLATACDPVKDQTDFLARITYDQLAHAMFPLGELPKSRVREIAAEQRLPNAARRDSQGICFLGKLDYNEFLHRRLGDCPGDIIELETGRRLGEHRGFWYHTIGQRKGLGLSGGPWYVVRKDIARNIIYVSNGYDTDKQYGRQLPLTEMHWITRNPWPDLSSPVEITFKNRHSPDFIPATLRQTAPGEFLIDSNERVQGIAPGQFAVIYDTDSRICFGSGMITAADPNIL